MGELILAYILGLAIGLSAIVPMLTVSDFVRDKIMKRFRIVAFSRGHLRLTMGCLVVSWILFSSLAIFLILVIYGKVF